MFVKVANVLLEDTRQFHCAPTLYVRSSQAVTKGEGGAWCFAGAGAYDFTTFFNALPVLKWDQYTCARGYRLRLELRGGACSVVQTVADQFDYHPRLLERSSVGVAASDAWQAIELPLSYGEHDVLCGFVIEAQGPFELRGGVYEAEVEEASVRPVELAIATTTFRKEDFITRTIAVVREGVLASREPAAQHVRLYVVDNGRTLDAQSLSGDRVTVFPNANVGGSGGFAYGMVKALEAGDVTHVLLMDDDVEVSPESILRTYNLLRIVDDEHVQMFVSGAMMSYDDVDLRCEDMGLVAAAGHLIPVKPRGRMSLLHACVESETFVPDEVAWPDTKQRYGGWWFCCIPVAVIREEGLPLPLFVRFDDVEYGLRCQRDCMTMNGICVWHLAFEMRYDARVERYQELRNSLIGQATTGVAPLTDFMPELIHCVSIELIKFNYQDAELACEAFEDFLRGPDYFSGRGVGEERFMAAGRNREHLIPLEDLAPQVLDELGLDVMTLPESAVVGDMPLGGRIRGTVYNMTHHWLLMHTLNGQVGTSLKPFKENYAIVNGIGFSEQFGRVYGVDTVLAINVQSKAGILRHRDSARGRQIWERFQRDLKRYRAEKTQLEARYAAARERLTSVAFWRDYLGLDERRP